MELSSDIASALVERTQARSRVYGATLGDVPGESAPVGPGAPVADTLEVRPASERRRGSRSAITRRELQPPTVVSPSRIAVSTAPPRLDLAQIEATGSPHGDAALARLRDWHTLLTTPSHLRLPELAKLQLVNDFFNRLPYVPDSANHWATPVEMLIAGGGDCEDYALAKYVSLRALGVPAERLRLVQVRALEHNEAHMVLAYTRHTRAEPVLLDNLVAAILPGSQRSDLLPVFAFDHESMWVTPQGDWRGVRVSAPSSRHALWTDFKLRAGLST